MPRMFRVVLFLLALTATVRAARAQADDPLPAGAMARFGTRQFRQHHIYDLAFLPDGKSILALNHDRGLVRWDVATGLANETLAKVPLPKNRLVVVMTRDAKQIATLAPNASIVLRDIATGKPTLHLKESQANSVCFSPDGATLAAASPGGIVLWDLRTGKEGPTFPRPIAEELVWSPDGKWIAGRIAEGSGERLEEALGIWDAATGKLTARIAETKPDDRLSRYQFTPNGCSLITCWRSGVRVWDLKTQGLARTIATEGTVGGISPDGKTIIAGTKAGASLYDVETGELRRRIPTDDPPMFGAAYSPDGGTLAIACEGSIQLYSVATGKRLDSFNGPASPPGRIEITPDGKTIAATFGQYPITVLRLLDAGTFQETARFSLRAYSVSFMKISPDGRRLALVEQTPEEQIGNPQPPIRQFDLVAGKEIIPAKAITGQLFGWKASGVLVVIRDGHWIDVDAASGEERGRAAVAPFARHSSVSADGLRFVVVDTAPTKGPRDFSDRNHLYLAEWPSGKKIRRFQFPQQGANDFADRRYPAGLSPDGRLAIAHDSLSGEERLFVSETATGNVRRLRRKVFQFDFSPDGQWILSRDVKNAFEILDALTLETLVELPVPHSTYTYAFSPTGKFLVTGGADTTLLTWDLTKIPSRKLSADALDAASLATLWADLRSDDAAAAHAAMITLARRPDEAVAFLRSRLPEVGAVPDPKTIDRLVLDLDDELFQTREKAFGELSRFAPVAGAEIRRALKESRSLEVRKRLTALLDQLTLTDADRARWLRSVELLERIGTPAARRVLQSLRSFADEETAADASRSLERLAGR